MTPARLAPSAVGIAALALVFGLVHEPMPFPLDVVMGIGICYLLPGAFALGAYRILRGWMFLVAPAVLLLALASGIVGDYLAYRWQWWGLEYSDYGSDDQPGQTQLVLRLWVAFFTALLLGEILALCAPAIRSRLGRAA